MQFSIDYIDFSKKLVKKISSQQKMHTLIFENLYSYFFVSLNSFKKSNSSKFIQTFKAQGDLSEIEFLKFQLAFRITLILFYQREVKPLPEPHVLRMNK